MSREVSAGDRRVLFFGTYDESMHPRVRALREGVQAAGADVATLNLPLGLDTAARVEIVRRPHLAVRLALAIAWRWARLTAVRLWRRPRPDVVIVGYLGHFDVHLARVLFPRSTIVLDHMVGLSDTAADRGLGGRSRVDRILAAVDRAALGAADLVLFDTHEHRRHLATPDVRSAVVPVGAPSAYFDAAERTTPRDGGPMRVLFYGLYTPLQGATTVGEAIGRMAGDDDVRFTMVGDGQDRGAAEAAATGGHAEWIDWIDSSELPALIAAHDVCLGIFGSSPKAQRVVPNKVYQGAAAGAAVVTSDTPCQREMLGDGAVFVAPGDSDALVDALRSLAGDRRRLEEARRRSRAVARARFAPAATVAPLLDTLGRRSGPDGADTVHP